MCLLAESFGVPLGRRSRGSGLTSLVFFSFPRTLGEMGEARMGCPLNRNEMGGAGGRAYGNGRVVFQFMNRLEFAYPFNN